MKRTILFICSLALLVAGCTREQEIETIPEGTAPRHLTFDITVNHEGPDTRAVKTGWENGDKIYVFFDFGSNTVSDEHMTMTYDGSKWDFVFSNETMEAALIEKTSGKLVAVYFPFGTPEFSFEEKNSEKFVYFNLDSDTGTNISYCWSNYTVNDNKLTATMDMSLDEEYVQFFIPGVSDASNLIFSCDKMKALVPESVYYTPSPGLNAIKVDRSKEYGDPMKGFIYQDGVIFSGTLSSLGTESDYSFTVTDTGETESTTDDIVYTLSITGKTLNAKGAVKLPALDSGRWSVRKSFVDMGEGHLWATCNIGANSPEESGDYFAWGEISAKESYTWDSYRFGPQNSITKYNATDGKTALEADDDAATVLLGEEWRIPKQEEWSWLITNGNWEYTDDYEGTEVAGMKVTSTINGNTLFLPMTGWYDGSELQFKGSEAAYWCMFRDGNGNEDSAFGFYMYQYEWGAAKEYLRYYGFAIRPVKSGRVSVTGLELEEKSITLKPLVTDGFNYSYDTKTLTATILPSNATDQRILWTSSDENVATVDVNGTVSGRYEGTAIITATTVDGGFTQTCEVTVSGVSVEGVTLDKTSVTIAKDGTAQLTATVLPADATNTLVEWTSANAAIAKVSDTGLVTGVAAGKTTITVTTVDGEFKATCEVTVSEDPLNGHAYVEMGVTSADGTVLKWATMNVGATSETNYGDYFAWGETEPYYSSQSPLTWKDDKTNGYDWSSYFDTEDNGSTFTTYNISGGKTVLEPEDDAASQNWGGTWRMPTDAEWAALLNRDNFDWEWDGTWKGYTVTSKVQGYEGNSIFLPAAGYRNGTSLDNAGSFGFYWSSSLDTSYSYYAWIVNFYPIDVYKGNDNRYRGLSVRPVSE